MHPALLDAHAANRADPADMQRAYLRFSWARRKAPARLPVVRWLLAGVAIGLGVASAATLIPVPGARTPTPRASAEPSAPAAKPHRAKRGIRNSGANAEPKLAEPLAPAPEPAPAQPPPLPVRDARGVIAQPAPSSSAAQLTDSASDWQRAATALRSGDLLTAEEALTKLERSDSLRDREAAELARAQLLVSRGRVAEAIPTLRRLARVGDSPVTRSQATSVLQSLAH